MSGDGKLVASGGGDDTLIAGENDAILVDALMTNDQADALAAWAKGFRKTS